VAVQLLDPVDHHFETNQRRSHRQKFGLFRFLDRQGLWGFKVVSISDCAWTDVRACVPAPNDHLLQEESEREKY
jgi:hypothetical protein